VNFCIIGGKGVVSKRACYGEETKKNGYGPAIPTKRGLGGGCAVPVFVRPGVVLRLLGALAGTGGCSVSCLLLQLTFSSFSFFA